jgi:hypothetical protein
MCKSIFPLLALLLACFTSTSQNEGRLYLEPSVAFTSRMIMNQNAYGNPEMPYVFSYGVHTGIKAYYFTSPNFGLNGGIGYGLYGQNYAGIQREAEAIRKMRLDYLQIPAMAMFSLHQGNNPTWFSIGPQLNILLSANQSFARDTGPVLKNPEYLPQGETNVYRWFKPYDVMLAMEFSWLLQARHYSRLFYCLSIYSAIGLLDINRKDYQIKNFSNIYGGSHNFYLGLRLGLMHRVSKNRFK